MNDLDLSKYDGLGNELAESGLAFEALTNPNTEGKYVKEAQSAAKIPAKAKVWVKANAHKGQINGFPYDGHNIPITKPAQPIRVSLEPVYRNLQAALIKFNNLGMKMFKFYTGSRVDKEMKEAMELREPSLKFKDYDYSVEAAKIKNDIKLVNECRVGDGKGGIIEPAETTIDQLDYYCNQIDGYIYAGNGTMIQIFDLILRNKLTLANIKEYEVFYKSVYLPLCEAVKKFYINVIEAIGEDADYEHSPDFVVDYFKRKRIADKASTLGIIPMTKNMFGESLHVEKASGKTVTGERINKITFESKVIGQQSSDDKFKKEMEKFTFK
ncbi:MAG: hypothetical protein LBQ76_06200 [Candidatus Fibromonas sp.]|jgi:hypothetical protein|nr:hypothetical protein [Candidatus Fibromonas sp.]